MRIELKKFGDVLTSRPAGREAFAAIRPTLSPSESDIEIDFSGIISLAPSWADEFFRALEELYGDRITYITSDNPSVKATMAILRDQAK
jgi:STAS-like domain of unknown function (DUF4325)